MQPGKLHLRRFGAKRQEDEAARAVHARRARCDRSLAYPTRRIALKAVWSVATRFLKLRARAVHARRARCNRSLAYPTRRIALKAVWSVATRFLKLRARAVHAR